MIFQNDIVVKGEDEKECAEGEERRKLEMNCEKLAIFCLNKKRQKTELLCSFFFLSSNASVWFTHFNLSLIPTVAAPTFLFLVRVSGKIIRIKDKTRTKKKRVRTTLETLYNFGCDHRAPCA